MKLIYRSAFMKGLIKAFDLFGCSKDYASIPTGFERDASSLRKDWEKVGKTISSKTRKSGGKILKGAKIRRPIHRSNRSNGNHYSGERTG